MPIWYTLLVRASLRGKVKKVADLQGRVMGVKGHVAGGRSTSQLFVEHLLAQAGLQPDLVNYVSAGQSYDSQHAALVSGTVVAIVGDEPFVTRLVRRNVAYVQADFHDLGTTHKQMGGLFLNGLVATREVLCQRQGIYSPDGRVSDEQLLTADRFLRASEPAIVAQGLSVRSLVDDRWAGRMP